MSNVNIKLSTSTQIKLLLPVLEQFTQNIGQVVETHYKTEVADADWFFISDDLKKLKWLKEHTFEVIWEQFKGYLSGEKKIFAFIEKQAVGLMNTEQTVWLFFSPVSAKDYFNKQVNAPKGFNVKSLINVPRIDLLAPLNQIVSELSSSKGLQASQKLKNYTEILKLSDLYMLEEHKVSFHKSYKSLVKEDLHKEIQVITEELEIGSLEGIRKGRGRLVCVFISCWRFFRRQNQLEGDYYKKLISDDKDEVLKGLKLAGKRVSDCN